LEDVDITEEEKDIIKAKLRTEPTPKEKQLLQQSLKALTLNRS
jgi:plasmid stability protein